MTLGEDNQLDVLSFLAEEPKTIEDFRQSEAFYVADLGRGVYPRSLIDMLIDMELVSKFTPYKATEDEIEAFINTLNNLSDERKVILEKYTSFQLTEFGKETAEASETRKEKNIPVMESVQPKEQYPAEVTSINLLPEMDSKFEGVDLTPLEEIDHQPKEEIEPEIYGEKKRGMSEVEIAPALHSEKMKEALEEISLVEGEADEEELMEITIRINQIEEELQEIEQKISSGDLKRKERKRLSKRKDDLVEEKKSIEKQAADF